MHIYEDVSVLFLDQTYGFALNPFSQFQDGKKNIVRFLPNFHQFCMDVHGIQIRWNFCEIFFRFKDRTFYLVFDFFNSAQTFYIYIFIQLKESILSNSFEFFQYHFPFRK